MAIIIYSRKAKDAITGKPAVSPGVLAIGRQRLYGCTGVLAIELLVDSGSVDALVY
jgi:hypothetical protein